jgi:hypothetical protein
MNQQLRREIDQLADKYVVDMGDIFWDRDAYHDGAEYSNPFDTAKQSVIRALEEFALRHRVEGPDQKN